MDQDRFDRIARALGTAGTRRAGIRAALGGVLGLGVAAIAPDVEAKGNRKDRDRARRAEAERRRRHECGPDRPCPPGFACERQGRKRRCSCPSGILCSGGCCAVGQVCQNGACVVPVSCIAPGQPCKNAGVPCCEGRTCSSGQGGEADVACYVHKTGACQSTADCVFGTACLDGRCGFDVPPPAATGAPCNPDIGQQCADPAAVCGPYDGPDAPGGAYCTLPLGMTCTGDPDCSCYRCGYPGDAASAAVDARGATSAPACASSGRLACCGPAGYACRSDRSCCLGAVCVNGTCQDEAPCDVCAHGCAYSSIAAAYADVAGKPAGSTITIAPGVYAEPQFDLTRDITFRRCGSSGDVVWQNSTGANYLLARPVSAPMATAVNLWNITFTRNPAISGMYVLTRFQGDYGSPARLTLCAAACTWRDYVAVDDSGEGSAVYLSGLVDATFTDCTFRDNDLRASNSSEGTAIYSGGDNTVALNRSTFAGNKGAGNGGAVYAGSSAVTSTGSTFTGNVSDSDGGAFYVSRATLTLTDSTLSGNIAGPDTSGGGGVYLTENAQSRLVIGGTTSITGNNAGTRGSGIRVYVTAAGPTAPSRVSGTTSANVFGNISAPDCQVMDDYGSGYAVTCDGWCVPAGGACDDSYTTCCAGSCVANVCT